MSSTIESCDSVRSATIGGDRSQFLDPQAAEIVQALSYGERASIPAPGDHLRPRCALNRLRGGGPECSGTVSGKRFLSDKLVAFEPEKAAHCYLLCRSLNVRRVVEAGTSFGVLRCRCDWPDRLLQSYCSSELM